MAIPLKQAVEMAVQGIFPDEKTQSVKLGKHNFYIRSIKNKNKLEKGETGYFRHKHRGKDDRVFFAIRLKGNGLYDAKITRIQYRGILSSGMKLYNLHVSGALRESGPKGLVTDKIIKFLGKLNLQKKIDGNWEVQAAKIVDAIGQRMAFVANKNKKNKENLKKLGPKGFILANVKKPG